MQALRLGLLVQRGAGLTPADHDAWMRFMERLVRTMAGRSGRGGSRS
jgi:hypothetical protein